MTADQMERVAKFLHGLTSLTADTGVDVWAPDQLMLRDTTCRAFQGEPLWLAGLDRYAEDEGGYRTFE